MTKIIDFNEWVSINYPNQSHCEYCDDGQVDCEDCLGAGIQQCLHCDSEYECKTCSGEGVSECEECLGTNIANYQAITSEYRHRLKLDTKRYKETMQGDLLANDL